MYIKNIGENLDMKINILPVAMALLLALSACSPSSATNHAAVGTSAVENQLEVMTGINKGNLPPDFTLTTIDGKQLNLRQFKNDNKPILLYFWASWCPYCSRDFDIVKNIYPKYVNKVTFLAIDLDSNEKADLISNYKIKKSLVGIDFAEADINVLSDYGITHTTTKYAIGKNGVILYKGSGVFNEEQWEILLSALANS